MILYHGSNVAVITPDILKGKPAVDFGRGFYLTSDLEQAKRWAVLKTKRLCKGTPTISEFIFHEEQLASLNVLRFNSPDADWLKFISKSRTDITFTTDYDLIIGPVANDNTYDTIQLYLIGIYDESEALRRLLPYKLKDQFAFKTTRSLELLAFGKESTL